MESKEDGDDQKEEDEDEDEEYECNKIASQLIVALIMKSRDAMKAKMVKSNLSHKDDISFLNMTKLYKHFSGQNDKTAQNIDMRHGYIVKRIVNSVFEAVIDDQNAHYQQYTFLKEVKKLNQQLHEFIAQCCQLICNIIHYEFDLCPIEGAENKSLVTFNERIHIRDNNLSEEDSRQKIDYCSFPGIIAKGCWNQFDSQINKDQMDKDQIEKVLPYRMCVVLNDEQ